MARLVSKLFAAGLFNSLPDSYVSSKEDQDQVNQNIKDYKEKGNKLNESLKKKQDKLANSDRLTDTDIKRYEADIEVLKDKIAINDENINGSKAQLTGNNEQFRKSMDNAINYNSRLNEDIRISNDAKRDNEQEKLENKLTGRNNLGNNEDQMRKQQNQKFVDKSRKFSKAGYNDEREKVITLLLNLREAKNTRNKESILHSLENVSKNIKDNKINELILSLVTELKKISINDSQYDQIISDTIENMKSESITRLFSDRAIKAITRFYANPPVNGNYGIADGFRQIGTGIGNMASDFGTGVSNAARSAWNGVGRAVTNMGNQASRVANDAWSGITNTANNVGNAVGNAYNTAANSVGNAYNNAVNTVQGWGNNISNAASNAYNSAANTLNDWGNGISNTYNNFTDGVKNAYNGFVGSFNKPQVASGMISGAVTPTAANITATAPQSSGNVITDPNQLDAIFNAQRKAAGLTSTPNNMDDLQSQMQDAVNRNDMQAVNKIQGQMNQLHTDDLQSRIQDAVNRNDTAEADRLSQELEAMNAPAPSLMDEY